MVATRDNIKNNSKRLEIQAIIKNILIKEKINHN